MESTHPSVIGAISVDEFNIINASNQRNANSGYQIITRSRSRKRMLEILRRIDEQVILSEILTRLPVKSLLRFKFASRRWLSIISSKNFRKTHLDLQHSEKKDLTEQYATLVCATSQGFAILHCLGSSLFSRSYMKAGHFESPFLTRAVPLIVGSCNGLNCVLTNGDCFVIANLFTREHRGVSGIFSKELAELIVYGFGYDEASGDHKIFSLSRTHLSPPQREIRLYSLKKDSWKAIDEFLGADDYEGRGEFVNGKLHWISNDYKKIISFDLGTEAAQVFDPPSSAELLFHNLGVLKGRLAVFCDKPNEGMEVWTMEKYGVKESWCRVMVVPYFGTSNDTPFNHPLYLSEDGVVITDVDHGSTMFIYNPKTGSVNRIRLKVYEKVYETYQIDFSIQSLISPLSEEPN